MKKKPTYKRNMLSVPRIHYCIKRHYKTKFKEKITTPAINKIWRDYIEEEFIKTLEVGGVVNIDDNSRVWVKAIPSIKKKNMMALLNKGLMYKNGRIVEANMNLSTSDYVYDITFETRRYKHKTKLFFQPHRDLSKAVREGILKGKLITREYVN